MSQLYQVSVLPAAGRGKLSILVFLEEMQSNLYEQPRTKSLSLHNSAEHSSQYYAVFTKSVLRRCVFLLRSVSDAWGPNVYVTNGDLDLA